MPCYHPITAYRARFPNSSGKHSLVFKKDEGLLASQLEIPCGQCIGCRLERSRQWAIRCVHEAQLHEQNSFITLTYSDEHIPPGGTLVKSHFQKFLKRLRRSLAREGIKIKFYMCGEYGSHYDRPHYHACIFGYDFPDKTLWSIRKDVKLYRSARLEKLWPFGHSSVGTVTFESAAYVARYIVKKILGKEAADHYMRFMPDTGEIYWLLPEYTSMSLKTAIGKEWYDQFHSDVYPSDEVILRGKKLKPPKYYNGLYEMHDPDGMAAIKTARRRSHKLRRADSTPDRLNVRERCKLLQAEQLIRNL